MKKAILLMLLLFLTACGSQTKIPYEYDQNDILETIRTTTLYKDQNQEHAIRTLNTGIQVIPYPETGLTCIGYDEETMACQIQVLETGETGYILDQDLEYRFRLLQQMTETAENQPNEYAQLVGDAIWGCFKSFVSDTDNPDEFMTRDGYLIRVIEIEGLRKGSKGLSDADIANGVLWENSLNMDIIIYDGEEWEDDKLFGATYRYYKDGTIERLMISGYQEFAESCRMTNGDAGILK